ncbi:hypothetical protein K469DRAFT_711741 [Zopfia rhizophila CBS 207.26]|uniref:Uncharacterized protein n=1 Tax=Zopfia rhizophila CBS 207.26 TaxID=1314779 RepID=A0A6A6DU41_9PEZI|nr:hypothetical protein K469DRAFT_711741 [Zopfia rhizophila CBS 207.26]
MLAVLEPTLHTLIFLIYPVNAKTLVLLVARHCRLIVISRLSDTKLNRRTSMAIPNYFSILS